MQYKKVLQVYRHSENGCEYPEKYCILQCVCKAGFYIQFFPFMFSSLQKRWKVSKTDLLLILCVFAITGTTTAFLSKSLPGWIGFTEETHWAPKLLLRLAMLLFGYQAILLCVAFLFGQFPFFWQFEKKLLQRLKLMKKDKDPEQDQTHTNTDGKNEPHNTY